MKQYLTKYVCCCFGQNQISPQPVADVTIVQPPQEPKKQEPDEFLDDENPVQAILKSPYIDNVTQATIDYFTKDSDNPYVTQDREKLKIYQQAVTYAKKQNPDSITGLLQNLLSILPASKNANEKGGSSINRKKQRATKIATAYGSAIQKSRNQGKRSNANNEVEVKTTVIQKIKSRNTEKTQPESVSDLVNPLQQKTQSKIRKTEKIIRLESKNSIKKDQQIKTRKTIDNSEQPKQRPKQNPNKRQQAEIEAEEEKDLEEVKEKIETLLDPVQNQQNEQKQLNIVKAFVFLYTSPYIYRKMNEQFTKQRYQNYAMIVSFVTQALTKLPKLFKDNLSVKFTSGISLYRGISKKAKMPKHGYWKAFTSTSLNRRVAEQFAGTGNQKVLIELQLKPPMTHMHIKVPSNNGFSFFNQQEVILFPFFHYEIIEKKENIIIMKEVKQAELKDNL